MIACGRELRALRDRSFAEGGHGAAAKCCRVGNELAVCKLRRRNPAPEQVPGYSCGELGELPRICARAILRNSQNLVTLQFRRKRPQH